MYKKKKRERCLLFFSFPATCMPLFCHLLRVAASLYIYIYLKFLCSPLLSVFLLLPASGGEQSNVRSSHAAVQRFFGELMYVNGVEALVRTWNPFLPLSFFFVLIYP